MKMRSFFLHVLSSCLTCKKEAKIEICLCLHSVVQHVDGDEWKQLAFPIFFSSSQTFDSKLWTPKSCYEIFAMCCVRVNNEKPFRSIKNKIDRDYKEKFRHTHIHKYIHISTHLVICFIFVFVVRLLCGQTVASGTLLGISFQIFSSRLHTLRLNGKNESISIQQTYTRKMCAQTTTDARHHFHIWNFSERAFILWTQHSHTTDAN